LTASAARTAGDESVWQWVTRSVAIPTSVELTLGETPAVPQVVLYESDGVFARYSAQLLEQSDYARTFAASFAQASGTTHRLMVLIGTAESVVRTGSPTQRRLRAPEFAGASGWNPVWEPRVTLPLTWTTSAFGWDAVGGVTAPVADGTIERGYTRSGVLPAP
jgi:hypothetical protein